jgi:hypothetical protein
MRLSSIAVVIITAMLFVRLEENNIIFVHNSKVKND